MNDDRAEVDGPIAPTASLTAIASPQSEQPDGASTQAIAAKPKRRGKGRPFTGVDDPRNNRAGRPRKGESYRDLYMKELDRHAPALVAAHIKRAQGQGVVAERAFALGAAYKLGQPRQPFVVELEDSPLLAFLARQQAREQRPYVDGSATVLPPAQGTDEPT